LCFVLINTDVIYEVIIHATSRRLSDIFSIIQPCGICQSEWSLKLQYKYAHVVLIDHMLVGALHIDAPPTNTIANALMKPLNTIPSGHPFPTPTKFEQPYYVGIGSFVLPDSAFGGAVCCRLASRSAELPSGARFFSFSLATAASFCRALRASLSFLSFSLRNALDSNSCQSPSRV